MTSSDRQAQQPQTPQQAFVNTGTSRIVPVILPAAVVGGQAGNQPNQITFAVSGTRFYVVNASNALTIQPQRGGRMGAQNTFSIGQGQTVDGGFDTLIISNPLPVPVVANVWVGFENFINDQLILVSSSYQQVAFPTNPTAGATTQININDLSGTTFLDINGKKWGAIQRVAILVFNNDGTGGTPLLLQAAATSSPTGPAVGIVQPQQPIRFDFGGNYRIFTGGGTINAVVSEIYQAFPV